MMSRRSPFIRTPNTGHILTYTGHMGFKTPSEKIPSQVNRSKQGQLGGLEAQAHSERAPRTHSTEKSMVQGPGRSTARTRCRDGIAMI